MAQKIERALFVGNGLHLAIPNEGISWGALLNRLTNSSKLKKEIPAIKKVNVVNPMKPFPFLFEEMVSKHPIDADQSIMLIKKEVSAILAEMQEANPPNSFHHSIMRCSVTDIITPNYDYAFEIAANADFLKNKENYAQYKLEKTKNLRRRYLIGKRNIWHMHGELSDCRNRNEEGVKDFPEQSILLGFSHYSKNLADIKNYVEGNSKIEPLLKRLNQSSVQSESWIDIFFTHNVDILGFGLGFEEQDIWWLLTFRAMKMRSADKLSNRIRFFVRKPSSLDPMENSLKEIINFYKGDAIREVLSAMNVEAVEIESPSWENYYEQAIIRIEND